MASSPYFALVAELGEVAGVIESISAEISGSGNAIKLPFAVPQKQSVEPRKKTDVTTKEDGKRVVTVKDAIKAVQEYFNSGQILGEWTQLIAKEFIGKGGSTLADVAVPIIARRIRQLALTQTNPRVTITKTVDTRKS